MKLRTTAVALAMTCALGCETEKPTPPPEAPKAEAQPPAPPPKPTSHADCVGPMNAGTPETVQVNGVTWELNGSTLTWKAPATPKQLVVGALTDIKENTEENLANLRDFMKWFNKNKVDLIVVDRDTGENQAQIEAALAVLAEAKVPVFNIVGNREGKQAYKAALTATRAKFPHVFDLNAVRRIDTPVADLVSLPGYFNKAYIHNDDGCQYFEADVAKVGELAKASNSPVVLVSHGGPKQDGAEGVDRTAEGANVGDPMLTSLLESAKIPFGIFGNIHEAGGRGTDLKGALIKAGTFTDSLYLNPGPADGVRWVMNDKTESVGMAGLLTIKDGKGKYEIFRAADPEKKLARGGKKK